MPSEIGMMGKCMRARYGDPCRSLAYQVKARVTQEKSMKRPIARSRLDARRESFIAARKSTRLPRPELATKRRKGYTARNSCTEFVTSSI